MRINNELDNIEKNAKELLILASKVIQFMNTPLDRRAFVSIYGFKGFLVMYFSHIFFLDIAPFHEEFINDFEKKTDFIGVISFRGSAKSTYAELYALYSALEDKSHYTLYLSETEAKSTQAVMNIKMHVENNKLLMQDYALNVKNYTKTRFTTQKWSESFLILNGNAIQSTSIGSQVRGMKFNNDRPNLYICDDLENTINTRTEESRRKNRTWFYTEFIEAMAQGELGKDAKIIVIGNLVHRDCILANLYKRAVDNKDILQVKRYPLIDENGEITWKGLYPNMEAIEIKKRKVMLSGEGLGPVIWAREYLLKDVDEDDQIIKEDDIHRYPDDWLLRVNSTSPSCVGVDLAISKKETADYTAMVKAYQITNDNGEMRIIIGKNNLKARLDFSETIAECKKLRTIMPNVCEFVVESVQYQQVAVETLQKNGINVRGIKPTMDKRAKLIAISPYIKSGMILFPESGAENILTELIGFGTEDHDDLVDALYYATYNLLDSGEIAFAD